MLQRGHPTCCAGILLLFFFTLAGCDLENLHQPQLPALTTEGRNTFGCEVNGEVWVPFRSSGDPNAAPSRFVSVSGEVVSIFAAQWLPDKNEWITFTFAWDTAFAGPYILAERGVGKAWASFYTSEGEFLTDSLHRGEVTIVDYQLEKNGQRRYLSGYFEFEASREGFEKVAVRNGRFDLRVDE